MSKNIKLSHITKIEGHASLNLSIDKGKVKKCELQSTEGSRYFEGLVKGRRYDEAPEITSRVCGICSSAHTICAIQAMERAIKFKPSEQTILLRELMTLGERIRSHATHLYFLALPDFVGYESALAMAQKYKRELNTALRLVKLGNNIVKEVAGRDIHPVSAQVGGFLHLPTQESLDEIKEETNDRKNDAISTAELFAKLDYPDFERKTQYFSLKNKFGYATLYGDLVSEASKFPQNELHDHLKEYHEDHGTSNFVVKRGMSYMVGALSRINNNFDQLSEDAKLILKRSGHKFPNFNPFLNNFAQAIELVHCLDRVSEIIDFVDLKPEPLPEIKVKDGHGVAAIEVPRGVLWHEYTVKAGKIVSANIITPTCQNLRNMNDDIKAFVPTILDLPKEKMILEIEKLIRAYDPCFSCSTHFLKVKFERT